MADTAAERERRDEQIRETIMAKLVETGSLILSLIKFVH